MDGLREALDAVEKRRRTLEVYTDDEAVASELETQFSTRNVRVIHRQLPSGEDRGFVVIRDAAGEFRGSLGIDHFQALLSPEIHPPWTLAESDVNHDEVLDFLDNTLFASYDRRQMLAVAREIEERAWRENRGTLYTGFQRSTAVTRQIPVYNRLARKSDLTVRIFIEDEWQVNEDGRLDVESDETTDGERDETDDEGDEMVDVEREERLDVEVDEATDVVSATNEEIGQFWFVLFDGGEPGLNACGLLAEERETDHYYGFWTFDLDRLDAIVSYLDRTYGSQY